MTKLLAIAALLLTACGGKAAPSNTANTSPAGPAIDPTLPSWAPKSCIAYHKAAVEAIDCDAIAEGKRQEIKDAYDAASIGWKAEQNADPARIEEIRTACEGSTESVRADTRGHCTIATQ